MNHSSMVLVGLVCGLAACSDRPLPLGTDATEPASLSRGGAPTPLPPSDPVVDEFVSGVCGFSVLSQSTGKQKVLELPGGRTLIIFPAFTITFINENTGRTFTESATGSVRITPLPDGNTELVFTGRNVVANNVGEEFFVFLIGRFSQVIGEGGSIVQSLEGNGQITDLCEFLAS
jgi:hypothetical protein